MPSSEIKRRRDAAYRKGRSDGMAAAAKMMQEIADKAENQAHHLVERWTSDLGGTDATRAAGVAAWIIGGFHGDIVAAQTKLERRDVEDVLPCDPGVRRPLVPFAQSTAEIERAVIAERQRCAEIASEEAIRRLNNEDGYPAARAHDFVVVARKIEREILKGAAPDETKKIGEA